MVVAGWAVALTAGAMLPLASLGISGLWSEWRLPAHVCLTAAYLVAASVGFTLAFGSASEGLGSALASLFLALPMQIASGRTRGSA